MLRIKQIFCGSVPFAPPATTLLERITYRLPAEYVKKNEGQLLKSITNLFTELGQEGFTPEILQERGNNSRLGLSTGQSKVVMLIGAILYKQFLGKPVLFVIDETLANLDSDTTERVCNTIKQVFKDSIVISVDHQAKSNKAFYAEKDYIDLAAFTPSEAGQPLSLLVPEGLGGSKEMSAAGEVEYDFNYSWLAQA